MKSFDSTFVQLSAKTVTRLIHLSTCQSRLTLTRRIQEWFFWLFEIEAKLSLNNASSVTWAIRSSKNYNSTSVPLTIQTVVGCLFTASDPREEIVSIKHPDAILFTTKLSKNIHQAGKPDRYSKRKVKSENSSIGDVTTNHYTKSIEMFSLPTFTVTGAVHSSVVLSRPSIR